MSSRDVRSVASVVGTTVRRGGPNRFYSRRDFPGSVRAIECALSRLVAEGELVRVRHGLYWKGRSTPSGMTTPHTLDVALEVAGPGSGPSGLSAAHFLGLSTQVPSIEVVAVPGRTPSPLGGVRFVARDVDRRFAMLTPVEVAVMEILRDDSAIEASSRVLNARVTALVQSGSIRFDLIARHIAVERHVAARQRIQNFEHLAE